MANLTQIRLKEILHYDPTTGLFARISKLHKGCIPGLVGNLNPDGYLRIYVDGKIYLAQRLVWLYIYGVFPPSDTDHINQVKSDNRVCNLRLATRAENKRNTKKRRDNKSGHKGVSWSTSNKKWRASCTYHGKSICIGYFVNIEDAARAYNTFTEANYGEFYHAV